VNDVCVTGEVTTASHRATSRGLNVLTAAHDEVHEADRATGSKGQKLGGTVWMKDQI
jgi:hypothetical protein